MYLCEVIFWFLWYEMIGSGFLDLSTYSEEEGNGMKQKCFCRSFCNERDIDIHKPFIFKYIV